MEKLAGLKTVGFINLDGNNQPMPTKDKNKNLQVKVYDKKTTAESVKTRLDKKAAAEDEAQLLARMAALETKLFHK